MTSKDQKKLKLAVPGTTQAANKNINISISYNITVGKNSKPSLIENLARTDKNTIRKVGLSAVSANKSKPSRLHIGATSTAVLTLRGR